MSADPEQIASVEADPTAIDLEAIKDLRYWRDSRFKGVISDLIAAVEALRTENVNLKRVADAKPEELNQELLDENEALRERVAKFGGVESIRFVPRGVEVNNIDFVPANDLENCQNARERVVHAYTETFKRAEAAEAHTTELAVALSELLRWHRNEGDDTDDPPSEFLRKAGDAIATTPAEALERARVIREALEKISHIQRDKCENASAEMLYMLLDNKVAIALNALAKLNALDRPAKEDTGS